jgi:hypothetical protein
VGVQRQQGEHRRWRVDWDGESGQAVLLLVAAMAAVLVGAVFLGGVAQGIGKGARKQRAADLGALAGARSMHESYTRLFEPPTFEGQANPQHLEVGPSKDLGRDAPLGVARPQRRGRVPSIRRDGRRTATLSVSSGAVHEIATAALVCVALPAGLVAVTRQL